MARVVIRIQRRAGLFGWWIRWERSYPDDTPRRKG